MKLQSALVLSLLSCATASAQVFNFSGINMAIPDGSSVGIFNTQTIATGPDKIDHLAITLNIKPLSVGEPAFNGDLYVTLRHESGFSVLMNRVGVRSGNPFGYDDGGGVSVTFTDTAENDIHNYRLVLSGNHDTPQTGPVTGVWAPDGRTDNPLSVLDSSARLADLSSLVGLDAKGDWTLFVADLSEGGKAVLESWGIEFTSPVPEPSLTAMAAGVALVGFALYRRTRQATSKPPTTDPS